MISGFLSYYRRIDVEVLRDHKWWRMGEPVGRLEPLKREPHPTGINGGP
jgi:hypothetical protein